MTSEPPQDETTVSGSLTAFQLGDSFLPVGTYTLSYGLEQFIAEGRVDDADDLQALLTDYLRCQVGPCEVVAVAAAWDADDLDAVTRVDERQLSVTLAAEFRESSTTSGRRLLELMAETTGDEQVRRYHERVLREETPGNHAAALGLIARCTGITREQACLLACHSFVVGLLGAAQRLFRLSHTDAQRVLAALHPVIEQVCSTYAGRDPETMAPFAPMVDVMGMQHERAERRLFLS